MNIRKTQLLAPSLQWSKRAVQVTLTISSQVIKPVHIDTGRSHQWTTSAARYIVSNPLPRKISPARDLIYEEDKMQPQLHAAKRREVGSEGSHPVHSTSPLAH